jgi:DNA-binding transcriptional LysR family regulator
MDGTPDWDSYRSLLAVLDEGSLSAAARRLGLAQPTVGRHIEAIERALKRPLFLRSQRGLTPTETALSLRPYAETLRANAEALVRAASRAEGVAAGAVRITASEVIAAEVLPYILKGHADRHPGLSFDVEGSNRNADLLSRAADIAVRMARPQQQALLAVRCGEVELGLHAAPAYVARHGLLERMQDAGAHRMIGFDRETPFIRAFLRSQSLPERDAFAYRTDNDLASLGALRAGFGVGVCQVGIARREGWVRLLPGAVSMRLETWIVMHEDLKANPACRATFDALAEGMRGYIATSLLPGGEKAGPK